jgi:hypothetical protein
VEEPMRRTLVLVSLFCVSLFCVSLRAEVIELKNGNKITGKLTAINGETFVVKTDYGDIQVPRTDVIAISFPDNEVKKADGAPSAVIDEALVDTVYVNHTANFQAAFPKGWKISPEMRNKAGAGAVASLISDDQSQYFMVTDEKFNGALNTYSVLAEAQFRSNFANYEKLEQTPAMLDGRNGIRMVFKADIKTGAPGTTLKFLVYIIPYEGKMVRVTLFTLEPLFNDSKPVFEKIAASYSSLSQ